MAPVPITFGAASSRGLGFARKTGPVTGQTAYTSAGTYTWVCPAGVTSVSVVCVGGGAFGGGALAYSNNISVTPGNSYNVVVGAGSTSNADSSYFNNQSIVSAGGATGTSGGAVGAGTGSSGGGGYGGGAGGYSGTGGNNASAGSGGGGGGGGNAGYGEATGTIYIGTFASGGGGGGGGVGLLGQGTSGNAGTNGSSSNGSQDATGDGGGGGGGGSGGSGGGSGGNSSVGNFYYTAGAAGTGGLYGGGGSYGGSAELWMYDSFVDGATVPAGVGANGAVRIIWPGNTRSFPSTNTGNL